MLYTVKGHLMAGSAAESLGALLARARRERGISQAELARRLGMSGPHLSRIEHGADLRVSTLPTSRAS